MRAGDHFPIRRSTEAKSKQLASAPSWASLPAVLLAQCATNANDAQSILALACVCKAWRAAVGSDRFDGVFKQRYMLDYEHESTNDVCIAPDWVATPWRECYEQRTRVERNWHAGAPADVYKRQFRTGPAFKLLPSLGLLVCYEDDELVFLLTPWLDEVKRVKLPSEIRLYPELSVDDEHYPPLVAVSCRGTVLAFNAATFEPHGHPLDIDATSIAVCGARNWLLASKSGSDMRIFSLVTGEQLFAFDLLLNNIYEIAVSANGSTVVLDSALGISAWYSLPSAADGDEKSADRDAPRLLGQFSNVDRCLDRARSRAIVFSPESGATPADRELLKGFQDAGFAVELRHNRHVVLRRTTCTMTLFDSVTGRARTVPHEPLEKALKLKPDEWAWSRFEASWRFLVLWDHSNSELLCCDFLCI